MMAKGTIVVDENLFQLVPALKEQNIHVITPDSGMSDKKIAEQILPNRIFLTNNSTDFLGYAFGLGIGLVSLESLKFIDPLPTNKNKTIQLILRAFIDFKIWSLSDGFLLELQDNGEHRFQKF